MSGKLFVVLLVGLCMLNASIAYRIPREIDVVSADDSSASSSESSEESLTKEDVQKMRADLNKVLPANIANRICDVFAEFADNASNENTTKASIDLVRLLVLGALLDSKTDVGPIVLNIHDCDDDDENMEKVGNEIVKQLPSEIAGRVGGVFSAFASNASNKTKAEGALELVQLIIQGAVAEPAVDASLLVINMLDCESPATTTASALEEVTGNTV